MTVPETEMMAKTSEWQAWRMGLDSTIEAAFAAAIAASRFVLNKYGQPQLSEPEWDEVWAEVFAGWICMQRGLREVIPEDRIERFLEALRHARAVCIPAIRCEAIHCMSRELPDEGVELWRHELQDCEDRGLLPPTGVSLEQEPEGERDSQEQDRLCPAWAGRNVATREFLTRVEGNVEHSYQSVEAPLGELLTRHHARWLSREVRRTRLHCRERITRLLGECAESLDCDLAELYLAKDASCQAPSLELLLTHGRRKATREIGCANVIDERDHQGFVRHVFERGESIYSNRCTSNRHYFPFFDDTRSEATCNIATASHVGNDSCVLGVLNIESTEEGHFRGGVEQLLESRAEALAGPILHWNAATLADELATPWMPHRHGWSGTGLVDRFCQIVSDVIDPDLVQAIVLSYDSEKQSLRVLGSSNGFGNEFKTQSLDFSTLLQHYLTTSDGHSAVVLSAHDDPICCAKKSRLRAISHVVVCPLPRQSADDCQGLVAVYLPPLEQLPNGERIKAELVRTLPGVAQRFIQLMEATERLKGDVAVLEFRRASLSISGSSHSAGGMMAVADALRDTFCRVFEADGCSIFCRLGEEIWCLSTTGLWSLVRQDDKCPSQILPIDTMRSIYRLDAPERSQKSNFCWRHPGICVRIDDMRDQSEPGLPDGFLANAMFYSIESLQNDFRAHGRRVLTMSLTCSPLDDQLPEGTVGDIQVRLARSYRNPPFTIADRKLFETVMRYCLPNLEAARAHFAEMKDHQRHGGLQSRPSYKDVFRSPIASRTSLRSGENAILVDVLEYLRSRWNPEGVEIALAIRHRSVRHDKSRYRLVGFRPRPKRGITNLEGVLAEQAVGFDRQLAWNRCFQGGALRSFVLQSGIHQKDGPHSGIRVPIRSWSGGSLVQGVLAIDAPNAEAITAQEAEMMFLAGLRLAAFWSICDPLGKRSLWLPPHPLSAISKGQGSLEEFCADFSGQLLNHLRRMAYWLTGLRLFLERTESDSPEWCTLEEPLRAAVEEWPLKDAKRYGVLRHRFEDGRWRVPLYLGTWHAGWCECGGIPEKDLRIVIGHIVAAWSQLIFLTDIEVLPPSGDASYLSQSSDLLSSVNLYGETIAIDEASPYSERLEIKMWNPQQLWSLKSAGIYRAPNLAMSR